MATASLWTQNQVTAAFQRAPELQNLLLHDVEETGDTLGIGSYGKVVKLRVAGATLCAGKQIHESLMDFAHEGAKDVVSRFLEECKLMAELRHPHIVQLLGVCFLSSSKIPVLVMELLSDCLQNVIETQKNLPLELKVSILTGVASALVYMHSRTPPIIHRDLTARNVLIDERSMKAKVSDLGNSRFVAKQKMTMTQLPGTLEYMPPEALLMHARYSDKLDMFSFGHLALYTTTQVFPQELLPPNACNPHNDRLEPRTEVERRGAYMGILYEALSEEHPLVKLVRQCLSNSPQKRPTAMEALQWLQDLDPDYETGYALHRGQMVDIIRKKDEEIEELRRQIENRSSGLYYDVIPEYIYADAAVSKSGPLEKLTTSLRNRKWKLYTFKIENQTLKYFKSGKKKPRGEIVLSTVTDVVIAPRPEGEKFCFEVCFSGKHSPWTLATYSVSERKSWMEAIQRRREPIIEENSAYGLLPITTAPDEDYEYIATQQFAPALVVKESESEYYAPLTLLRNKDDRATERVPDYDETFATINRRAPKFTPTQMEHMIAMVKSTHSSLQDTTGDGALEENSGDSDTYLPICPRSTSPQPYYVEISDDEGGSVHEDNGRTNETLSCETSKSQLPLYVNLAVCDHEREVSQGVLSETESDSKISPHTASRALRCINYCDVTGGSTPKPTPLVQCSHSHDTLSGAASECPKEESRCLMPAPKPPFISKPTKSYLQPIPDTHSNPRWTLRNILKQSSQTQDPESLLITEDDTPEDYILRPLWARANTSDPGTIPLAELHRKALYISPTALSEITELGEGQFGKVYKAKMMGSQQSANVRVTVAVKTVAQITLDFRNEVTIMSEVVHPNIVRLYGLINQGEMAPAMVMEYLPNRDLKTFLSRNQRDKLQLMKYMIDVAIGMHYLSEKGIIHRDLAARNILLDVNEMCKVADFGLVREVPRESMVYVSRYKGPSPLRWMAPESISKRVFSPASDIWSYGILLWEMLNPTKLYPYPSLQNDEVVQNIPCGYKMPIPRGAPRLVARIMKACWHSEPDKRPSFCLISSLLTGPMIAND